MNTSFDRLHLMNTYAAFGHVGKTRHEIVLQGTYDDAVNAETVWFDYEFKGKPTALDRRPPFIAPYHYRLDWQIWFVAMSNYQRNPWLVHFVYKLLRNDQAALAYWRRTLSRMDRRCLSAGSCTDMHLRLGIPGRRDGGPGAGGRLAAACFCG